MIIIRKHGFWVFMLIALVVILGFSASTQKAKVCNQIKINIDHSSGNFFVLEEDINTMVYHEMDTLIGRPISAIQSERLEKKINNHPSIDNVEVYKTINGELVIQVKQRKPIVRLFNVFGESFYLDQGGWAMPTSERYASRVLIANGYIFESFVDVNLHNVKEFNDSLKEKSSVDDIFAYAEYINGDEFWRAQIEQLYVNKELDIELIPRVGNHRIVFGDATNIREKFNKLRIFYSEGLSKTGWNEYSVINLKYANQVVCKKR